MNSSFPAGIFAALLIPTYAAAQSGYDAETFRRFFDGLSSPRLSETLGLSKAGVIAMDGEATVRARPDAVQLRVGVTAQAATPYRLTRTGRVAGLVL